MHALLTRRDLPRETCPQPSGPSFGLPLLRTPQYERPTKPLSDKNDGSSNSRRDLDAPTSTDMAWVAELEEIVAEGKLNDEAGVALTRFGLAVAAAVAAVGGGRGGNPKSPSS